MSYADLDIGFGRKEDVMDRRDILAERPVESGRGFMPGVSVNPSRVLFTAGLTGRGPDGNLVAGGREIRQRDQAARLRDRPRGLQRERPRSATSSSALGRPRPGWSCGAWPTRPC